MKSKWIIVAFSAIGIIGAVALAGIVYLSGVYRAHWENPMAVSVAKTFSFIPAARIGGRAIPLRDYYRDLNAVKTYLSSDEAKSQSLAREVTATDRKQVIERLLTESAIDELAALRKVKIDESELDRMIDQEFNASGTTRGDLSAHIEKTYGWTYDDFKAHIARPALLTRYLMASFSADHPNDPEALQTYLEERLKRSDVVRYIAF
jgi:hypothetical protein